MFSVKIDVIFADDVSNARLRASTCLSPNNRPEKSKHRVRDIVLDAMGDDAVKKEGKGWIWKSKHAFAYAVRGEPNAGPDNDLSLLCRVLLGRNDCILVLRHGKAFVCSTNFTT